MTQRDGSYQKNKIKLEKFRAEAPIKILTTIVIDFCLLIDSVNTAV
jgi:hypothetical protein